MLTTPLCCSLRWHRSVGKTRCSCRVRACLCVSVCVSVCVCASVRLCLCQWSVGKARPSAGGHKALKPCLTSSGRALVLACFVGFPTAHSLSHCVWPWQRPLCARRLSLRHAVRQVRVDLPTQHRRPQYLSSSTQHLPGGEGNIPNAIVDAQLTHAISRDDDTEMPAAPLTHDISTPRRLIGGRCRKWAVSTQNAADKRRCASCTMCGHQFTRGEPRLQQWCNRDSHRAQVHTLCINGGAAHDHELHPKQPTDQNSVEAVAASVIASPRRPPTLRLSSLSLRALIKPPQQLLQMTSQPYSAV